MNSSWEFAVTNEQMNEQTNEREIHIGLCLLNSLQTLFDIIIWQYNVYGFLFALYFLYWG